MAKRRQQRKRKKQLRHAPRAVAVPTSDEGQLGEPGGRLVYSREQAAQALGVSLATLDRRVVPAIPTVKTEWGARLIPARELERYLAERTEEPQMPRPRGAEASGRKPAVPPEVVGRIRRERACGAPFAEIARGLNHDRIPTAQCGRQWWPSTVRAVLRRATI